MGMEKWEKLLRQRDKSVGFHQGGAVIETACHRCATMCVGAEGDYLNHYFKNNIVFFLYYSSNAKSATPEIR